MLRSRPLRTCNNRHRSCLRIGKGNSLASLSSASPLTADQYAFQGALKPATAIRPFVVPESARIVSQASTSRAREADLRQPHGNNTVFMAQ